MAEDQGLLVRALAKHFGGVQAVKGIDFSVAPGECVALIGPNGAGKSTTFACIAGQYAPSAGQVLWQGQRVDTLTPAQRLQRGIARSFQVAQIFEALTVLHNVQLLLPGTAVLNPFRALDSQSAEQAVSLLERVGLGPQAHSVSGALPYGAKKRLELAMALAGLVGRTQAPAAQTAAALLLLDEPAAGLAATERADLMALVRSFTRPQPGWPQLAVLYTEHNMDAVFGVADRVLVLMEGRIAASGSAQEVASHALVRSAYLGQAFQVAREGAHA